MTATTICVDGLISTWCGDEWQDFACHGCPGCVEASS